MITNFPNTISLFFLEELIMRYFFFLQKRKEKDEEKTYIWVSVWWKTKTKTEESTRLTDTGLVVELEHLKIKTRLIDEKFASVMGKCVI